MEALRVYFSFLHGVYLEESLHKEKTINVNMHLDMHNIFIFQSYRFIPTILQLISYEKW